MPTPESSYYPFALRDKLYLQKVDRAEARNLPSAIKESLAWKEGLQLGEKGYNLEDPGTLTYLFNKFTTAESAMDRPTTTNLDAAIGNRLDTLYLGIIEQAGAREPLPTGGLSFTPEEKESMAAVTRLISWVEARHLLDMTFLERMMMCSSEDNAAELAMGVGKGGRQPTTPDKGHWQALFGAGRTDSHDKITPEAAFGDQVDLVLRGIVACGVKEVDLPPKTKTKLGEELPSKYKIPENIYATGFKADKTLGLESGTDSFKNWMRYLLTLSKGDMGVVWTAWRLALTWELTSEYGHTVETSEKGSRTMQEHKIGTSPIVGTLFMWVRWFNEKRALEYGYRADNRTRDVHYNKNISHSGHPLSIGEIPEPLCQDFLHETKYEAPKFKKNGDPDLDKVTGKQKIGKRTLWEEWWGKEFTDEKGSRNGKELGGISLADANFPWLFTEKGAVGAEPGAEETSAGGYVSWLFKRRRAFKVQESFREAPYTPLSKIADPEFFAKKVRDWSLLCGPKENTLPSQNVMALYVRDLLASHHWELYINEAPALKNPDKDFRATVSGRERLSNEEAGKAEKGISYWDILRSAYSCGFLRKQDIEWLVGELKIAKGLSMQRHMSLPAF